jgi:hypothetical protein
MGFAPYCEATIVGKGVFIGGLKHTFRQDMFKKKADVKLAPVLGIFTHIGYRGVFSCHYTVDIQIVVLGYRLSADLINSAVHSLLVFERLSILYYGLILVVLPIFVSG